MKGQLEVPVIGIIATIVIVLAISLPLKQLTSPLIKVVKYEEKHDNSQMTLVSLLTSTKDGRTIQELIGEYIVLKKPTKAEIGKMLTERLDKLVESGCYQLSTSSETLVKSPDCEPKDYKKEVDIPLPYNSGELTEKLTLVMN